MSLPAKAD